MNDKGPDRHGGARGWRTGAAWGLLAVGLIAAFGHNFWEMWHRWFPAWKHHDWGLYDRLVEGESYYTHGPLVPLVSLLIAVLLIRHTRVPARPNRRAGWAVLAFSLLLHLASCLARVNFASCFALIGVLAGLVLLLWGAAALRRLWFPLAFLAFMVPLPEVSIAQLNFRLKMIAADWGVGLANAAGVIAEHSGNCVFLPGDKNLIIGNICNGLRTLISLLAFGALYAYVCRLRGLWRIGLFLMSVPVAVVSNSVRIVSLIVVADVWTVEAATAWFHDASGLMIFVLAFGLMFGLERLVLGVRRLVGRPAKIVPLFDGALRTDADQGQWGRLVRAVGGRPGWIAGVVVALAAGGALWLNLTVPAMWNQKMAARAVPADLEVNGQSWRGYHVPLPQRILDILGTTDYLSRQYVGAGREPIYFVVIFSKDNRKGTHPPDLCLEGGGQEIIAKKDVVVRGVAGRRGPIDPPCRELIVQSRRNLQCFTYTYKCGDTYTRSFWWQQWVIFANGLLNRNAAGALIWVSTPATEGLNAARERSRAFLRVAVSHLDRNLP